MPMFWRDYVRPAEHLPTLRERRRDVYRRIDEQGFGWKIVIVAGVGFLTDAYDIFAVNIVLPLLEIVYWQGNKLPARQETVINLSLLLGTMIGQLAFGLFADRYGRKKMYGFELLIVIVATMGLALCSKGARGSVNILAWVISWRLLMGIGIGADYPLSAVIVSEFSPRKHRARMLAAVFYMQPVGQFFANIITIIATQLSRRYISHDSDPSACVGDCMETTDKIWRWVVGLGAVPPALALFARLFIPESPRYLLEVEKDSHTAYENAMVYFSDPFENPEGGDPSYPDPIEQQRPGGSDGAEFSRPDEFALEELHQEQQYVPDNRPPRTTPDAIEENPPSSSDYLAPGGPIVRGPAADSGYRSPQGSSNSRNDIAGERHSDVSSINRNEHRDIGWEQPQHPPSQQFDELTRNNNNISGGSQNPPENTDTRKASWKEFFGGFHDFLFKPDPPRVAGSGEQNNASGARMEPGPSVEPERRWNDGNWTDLAGTSLAWFLLDFSFYFLGVNSWKVIAQVWDTPEYTSVYQFVIQFSWRGLVLVSVSSLIGGALFIALAKYRHSLQTHGFLTLAGFLVAVGITFVTILGGRYFAAIIVLYFFTQLFFDFGPNTSTFIIPAEVFPTQYRATCHGISAAFGKLGSIAAQIIAETYIKRHRPRTLGYTLILFSAAMILGAVVTKLWVPNPCNVYSESRSLEDLSKGKRARKEMERAEKEELRRAEKERHELA